MIPEIYHVCREMSHKTKALSDCPKNGQIGKRACFAGENRDARFFSPEFSTDLVDRF
jgi:hypothetical protein